MPGEKRWPVVATRTVAAVTSGIPPGRGHPLSIDQAVAVEEIATSGRRLDVLVGPAGSGKSTTMAALRAAWKAEHGPGSVLGLAPWPRQQRCWPKLWVQTRRTRPSGSTSTVKKPSDW